MKYKNNIVIATRKSPLALWQANYVANRLRVLYPHLEVTLLPMTTRGDEVLDRALADLGGKGLFLKELEQALVRAEADIAVHSCKDMPMVLDPGFVLGAVLERADSADAFVSAHYATLSELPINARVGTSSQRRRAQLLALRPDLEVVDLRGNVATRLAQLDQGYCDAIILAVAGLERLKLQKRIRSRLTAPLWLPAAGQGAIAIELRVQDHDHRQTIKPLNDESTYRCVVAERAMSRRLEGSCAVPIGAYALETETGLTLWGMVGDARAGQLIRAEAQGATAEPESLGVRVAEALLRDGAAALLKQKI